MLPSLPSFPSSLSPRLGQSAHSPWPSEISSAEAAEHAHIESSKATPPSAPENSAEATKEHESKYETSRAEAAIIRGIAPVATSKDECVDGATCSTFTFFSSQFMQML